MHKQQKIELEISDIDRQILVLNRRKGELEAELMRLNKMMVRKELGIVDGARLEPTEAFAQFLRGYGWEVNEIAQFVSRGLSFEASGDTETANVRSGKTLTIYGVPLSVVRNMRDLWIANHPS